ncbi:flagellar basal body P-ring formation chaperone FlgA [Caballeronia ptereochthonis]|uniref:Flagellar basal body P-ring biosynthesis protein FlgA n=1 Tax=Caballeronia ptereochthonis TaxID=1777144 RepID=A0A158E5D8_9BURK|nr:flagellar basal body P-ring formation chaperone FlgA [Caballeronia ptereochthonis]SAL02058.1 flagellar basal body P-ring biosynthesis protein FlgA [Caballeronia ptereochthonis]
MSRSAKRASNPTARAAATFARRTLRGLAGVSLFIGVAAGAHAQQGDGPIVIPGNAETNPAAVAEMAKSLNAPAARGSTSVAAPVSTLPAPDTGRPSGYRAATKAADAAMRNAALELEARADAADDSMNDASGMIVIPGPGEAKPARAAVAASALPKAPAASALHDVIPVVVTRDDAVPARNANTRPVAASAAAPVTGAPASPMKRVSFTPANSAAAAPSAAVLPQAPGAPAAMQDGESIRLAALNFLQQQAAGLPGKAEITVTPVFPRGLAPCSSLDPFMPTGARLWGRMTVGVRCVGERPWTLYVQARVSINATYYLAARAIAPGEVLGNADLVARDGDITAMPQAIVTDPAQAVGAVALSRVPAGLPLRTDMLRAASSVAIGQNVRVVAAGSGFSISAEGSAMNNAAPGQQVRVKTAGGQIITGIVKDSQTVEVSL